MTGGGVLSRFCLLHLCSRYYQSFYLYFAVIIWVMAMTCWSYTAVRELISLNRNASNFPRAIILCPQQNKRVIFLKMRGIEILDKSYGKCCTYDCGNCSFHKHLACLIWGCGLGADERVLKSKNFFFLEGEESALRKHWTPQLPSLWGLTLPRKGDC